jgi:pyruvate dehydrogenase E1 component
MQAKAKVSEETTDKPSPLHTSDSDPQETREWLEAFDQIITGEGADRGAYLLSALTARARSAGFDLPPKLNTPFVNSIHVDDEEPYPGDRTIERHIKSILRWNAMAMVVQQNKKDPGIGGHISTYASQATLMEVGFNHFFRASYGDQPGDLVYFQGHASPGVYARAHLEGRLTLKQLENFRHELHEDGGLSSYPHPWLMPDFWSFPTVSMGLGPLNAIYQARFMRYLENRGLIKDTPRKVWAFLGDGEMDEPESMGSLTLASRERLDNLIFVINCNLQRLDGPVRGNGKIVQELEAAFRGAGWNVLKVLWGSDWDPLFERDQSGLLLKRMEECVDGELQSFKAKGGAYIRKEFFGKYPELLKLVEDKTDEEIGSFRRGGHDPVKVYNAYKAAVEHQDGPTVILAMTVKGYGLGASGGEGRNLAHQSKKLSDEDLELFQERFEVPISDEKALKAAFYEPPSDGKEMVYLHERRKELGGYLPSRSRPENVIKAPALEFFKESLEGSNDREVSTAMAFVRILTLLLKSKELGKRVVPIIPDEARTFGMESLFRQIGIYASQGQLYKPHDADMFLYYKEAKDGQILEEGITEAGSVASFTAAGTAYSNYQIEMIPFFIYYSMFGFQRVGDFVWAFADSRGKGFLMGGTAGRTTLSGEGLQHQDGHSLVLASTVPTCAAYDPAYAYEVAVIIQDGIRRMYVNQEDRFYYLTLYNENYVQPSMPEGVQEGILKGLYLCQKAQSGKPKAQLFGSGPILREALRAQEILAENYKIAADVWSVTSYNELRREALAVDRWNRLHPEETERIPYIQSALKGTEGPVIAASDYMKIVPDQISPWLGGRLVTLGTDGFGRSDNREYLRRHFEVNAEAIVAATLSKLARDGKFNSKKAAQALVDLGINIDAKDPAIA